MILAPTLTLNSTARGLDADATAFAAASGATDVAALSAFVKGVKELGLWNSMVCWPLRSAQNAGNGDTVYSLGGLGTFNGTRVGGPTWTADGVNFDGSDDRITTGTVPITGSNPRTLFVVGKSSTGNLNVILAINPNTPNNIDNNTWGILHFPSNTQILGWDAVSANNVEIGTVTSGVFSSMSYGWGSARFGFINGTQTLTGSSVAPATGANSLLSIGASRVSASNFTWNYNGQIAFAALFNTGSASTNIHTLYKSTLGTGLGLP